MLQAEVRRPRALADEDIAAWRAFQAADPAFANPLLGPDFARLVDEVREDARVAVFRREGRAVGFLPFHSRLGAVAQPIGAAFSDYHALVAAPGERIDGLQALAAARVGAIRFAGLIDPHGAFPAKPSEVAGFVIAPGADVETHRTALREANPKRFKNWRRLGNKLEREWGPIEVVADDRSPDAFELLLEWKRDQFRRTGAHDMLRPEWARRLFQRIFEAPSGELRGVMTTLKAGGKVVAGHFGVAAGGVAHIWLSSMDPDAAACGPGTVLMLETAEVMQALGLTVYDLGPSHDHYKAPFATGTVAVSEGLMIAKGAAGLAARTQDRAWALAGDRRVDAVGRLRRRLDHIAGAEMSMGGQVRGVVEALAGYGRRSATRAPARAESAPEDA